MKNSTQHPLSSKGGFPEGRFSLLFLRGRAPSKNHACFLEGTAWNFLWLTPPWPTSYQLQNHGENNNHKIRNHLNPMAGIDYRGRVPDASP